MERKHSYENGDVIPESYRVPKHGDRCEAVGPRSRSRRDNITRASRGRLGPYPRIPACEARHWHISSARDRPKGPSRRARRPAAHRLKKNPSAVGAPKPTLGGFWRGMTRQYRANRVISQTVPHPYMMLMLGRGQWARQGSMRSDAGVSGVYAPL